MSAQRVASPTPSSIGIQVTPLVMDFGNVRVNQHKDSALSIFSSGTQPLTIRDYSFGSIDTSKFDIHVRAIPTTERIIPPNVLYFDSIRFSPQKEGRQQIDFDVLNDATSASASPRVTIVGTGVYPRLVSNSIDYGKVRVNTSKLDSFVVRSVGSDTTNITEISLIQGSADFFLDIPGAISDDQRVFFMPAGNAEASFRFYRVQFTPKSLGAKMGVVRLRSRDTAIHDILDTLWGVGVEPYITASPLSVVIPTIYAPLLPNSISQYDTFFVVRNTGTMAALIKSLQHAAGSYFTFTTFRQPDITGAMLPEGEHDTVYVHFQVREAGDFYDTVRINNDSPNDAEGQPNATKPIVLLKASVRSGPATNDSTDFGVVIDCTPQFDSIVISNPNSVSISIDTIFFVGDVAGFDYTEQFLFPINIQPGGEYHLKLTYNFPPDLLNGDQELRLVMRQRVGQDPLVTPILLTAKVRVRRKIRIIQLTTESPKFTPSAVDAVPFRLPINVVGERANNTELDNFELKLKFDNELFQVVGMDRTGSLLESISPSDNTVVNGRWDDANRTYSITVQNAHVSDPRFAGNDLLVTVLVRSFVTPDTNATVTPEFIFARRPCAYGLAKQGVNLHYDNDCGDLLLRSQLSKSHPELIVNPARPNPTNGKSIRIPIELRDELMIGWTLVDGSGKICARSSEATLYHVGQHELEIALGAAQASGATVLRIEVLNPASGARFERNVKISVNR